MSHHLLATSVDPAEKADSSYFQMIDGALQSAVDFIWGPPLVILLLGGGTLLLLYSRFMPLLGLWHAVKLLRGKYQHEHQEKAEGQITHFQALCNAVASTVGMGNIGGVAVALTTGGPGAIFWMWMAGLVGMNTKFFECTLALIYRGRDYRGEVQGGMMYVIASALPWWMRPLGVMFAVCGLVGTLALFQINQLTSILVDTYLVDGKSAPDPNDVWWFNLGVGVVCAGLVAWVLAGGLRRLARTTSALVPTMCLLYVGFCVVILILRIDRVPAAFGMIFDNAFGGVEAAGGGILGYAFKEIAVTGVKRAVFSNEAGVGTASMAHSNARTSEPLSEGLVSLLEPLLDTLIVCTMTALVLLTALDVGQFDTAAIKTTLDDSTVKGVLLTKMAFESTLGQVGVHFLCVAVFLFAFTTMIGMANYNGKCYDYLFRGRFIFKRPLFIFYFCASLIVASVSSQAAVINLLDSAFGLMALPTMITMILLAPKVYTAMQSYYKRYGILGR